MTAFHLVKRKWKMGSWIKDHQAWGCKDENGIWMVFSSFIICTDKGTNLHQKEQGKSSFPQIKQQYAPTSGFTFFIIISSIFCVYPHPQERERQRYYGALLCLPRNLKHFNINLKAKTTYFCKEKQDEYIRHVRKWYIANEMLNPNAKRQDLQLTYPNML